MHTPRRVAEVTVHGTGIEDVVSVNLTLWTVEETVIPTSVLAVIVVPVCGGHVTPLAMERLESIRGLDTPAVLAVVCGNRTYEKASMKLDAFTIPHGLKMTAGTTFMGRYSYSTNKCPIANGRPNELDLDYAEDFGEKMMGKIQVANGPDILYQVDVRTVKRPSQPSFPLFRFLRKVIKLRKSDTPPPRTPWIEDEGSYTRCGIYVACCPAGVITRGDELSTNVEKCIKCYTCVRACVNKTGKYDTPFASLLSECFKE